MAVGPILRQPRWPELVTDLTAERPCSREAYLKDKDVWRDFHEQEQRCERRRTDRGFETVDNLRRK